MELSETFWVTFITMGFAFVTGSLAYTLKSKCSSVKICGCIDIQRDVELEADIEDNMMRQTVPITEPIQPTTQIFSRRSSPINSRRESFRQSRLAQTMVDFTESMKSMPESKSEK